MRTEDGGYRWVATTIRYLEGRSGHVDRFVGVGVDVSERVAAEAEAEASREMLERLLRVTPAMVYQGRIEPRVIDFISPGVEAILGYRPEEIEGVDGWLDTHVHPDESDELHDAAAATAAAGGGADSLLARILAKDGTYRSLLVTSRIEADGSYVASAVDVTERQGMEARLRVA